MLANFPLINTILTVFFWFIFSGWAIALPMLVLLPRRQNPAAARSWLLLIFFMPWLGLLLYLLIGENRLPPERLAKHRQIVEKLKAIPKWSDDPAIVAPPLEPALVPTVTLAQALGQMPVLGGNQVELIPGYTEIIDRLIADIDLAERHVHLLYYIIADDETGHRLAEALERAIKRGVKCRVLVDSFGALPFIKKLGDKMVSEGIELHYILPIGPLRHHLTRVDLRNHRKIAVIDGQVAYTGSQNIVNADYGYDIEGLTYEELMVRLTGPIVLQLQAIFAGDWYMESDELLTDPDFFPSLPASGQVLAQAVPSGPSYGVENFQRLVVALIHDARQRVVITTPYFIPDESFIQALETAVMSGVEITLIVSSKVDQAIVGWAQSSYYEQLLAAGVKLYVYGQALLHAKHMSVDDDLALIGSGNMDRRSFDLNYEITMLFYGTQVVQALHAEERRYIDRSEELSLTAWQQRPAKEKFLQNIAKLVSPML